LAVLDLPESLTFYRDTWETWDIWGKTESTYCDDAYPDTYTLTYIGIQVNPLSGVGQHIWSYQTREVFPGGLGNRTISHRLAINDVDEAACLLEFGASVEVIANQGYNCIFSYDTTVVIPYPFQVIFYRGGLLVGTITE
jgi:hypothetical protein